MPNEQITVANIMDVVNEASAEINKIMYDTADALPINCAIKIETYEHRKIGSRAPIPSIRLSLELL